jgi:hypothetical protein
MSNFTFLNEIMWIFIMTEKYISYKESRCRSFILDMQMTKVRKKIILKNNIHCFDKIMICCLLYIYVHFCFTIIKLKAQNLKKTRKNQKKLRCSIQSPEKCTWYWHESNIFCCMFRLSYFSTFMTDHRILISETRMAATCVVRNSPVSNPTVL